MLDDSAEQNESACPASELVSAENADNSFPEIFGDNFEDFNSAIRAEATRLRKQLFADSVVIIVTGSKDDENEVGSNTYRAVGFSGNYYAVIGSVQAALNSWEGPSITVTTEDEED